MNRRPFIYLESDDAFDLRESVHKEIMEREVQRLWPKLCRGDNGSVRDPDGHISAVKAGMPGD